MTKPDGMKLSAFGRKRQVGLEDSQFGKTAKRMLCIPEDEDRLTAEDWLLVDRIRRTHDLSDYGPGNQRFGPHSGMSPGERLIRAYNLGLLVRRSDAPVDNQQTDRAGSEDGGARGDPGRGQLHGEILPLRR